MKLSQITFAILVVNFTIFFGIADDSNEIQQFDENQDLAGGQKTHSSEEGAPDYANMDVGEIPQEDWYGNSNSYEYVYVKRPKRNRWRNKNRWRNQKKASLLDPFSWFRRNAQAEDSD